MSTRGEPIFTSFDTDSSELFKAYPARAKGTYTSRCVTLPTPERRPFCVGINASSYHIRRYFQDEQALTFSVDASGAPGTHWPEPRPAASDRCWTGRLRARSEHGIRQRVKNLMDDLPFGADIYWQLRGKRKPWSAHYELEGLKAVLPQRWLTLRHRGQRATSPETSSSRAKRSDPRETSSSRASEATSPLKPRHREPVEAIPLNPSSRAKRSDSPRNLVIAGQAKRPPCRNLVIASKAQRPPS
jgi:hypothetical protein